MVDRKRLLAILVLVVLAAASYGVRRALIRGFFVDSAPLVRLPGIEPPPLLSDMDGDQTGDPKSLLADITPDDLPPTSRVRVVLLDGLGLVSADALPHLRERCSGGATLQVDNGFPTVSLPVQHVLWTGLTQQQSGVAYRVTAFEQPPANSLPALVEGSVAVAESHPEIAGSFGFSEIKVASDLDDASWREQGFEAAALEAVRSSAPMVFVHVLRIDEAGHRHGADSSEYREAARWSDNLFARLVDADPQARWFVLADHGHRPAGGHGGAEPEIRIVRACVFGRDVTPTESDDRDLVDVSRALFASTGQGIPRATYGEAWSKPNGPPELLPPRPGQGRWVAALTLIGMAIGMTQLGRPQRWTDLPVWLVLAVASLWLIRGAPSLSHPMVYPPLGLDMHLAALPGYLLVGWTVYRRRFSLSVRRTVWLQFVVPMAICFALSMLCGAFAHLVSGGRVSLLMPVFTAWASVAWTLLAGGAATSALALGLLRRRLLS